MADKHPIEGIMYTALQGLKDMIDVNTIVGDAITSPDGSVIIPISKVAIGFGECRIRLGKTTASYLVSCRQVCVEHSFHAHNLGNSTAMVVVAMRNDKVVNHVNLQGV